MVDCTIEVTALSKRFGSVHAVRDLSFVAEPGRVTGFLGPNGSGKTTTLAALLGLVKPDAGHATIGGVPYTKLPAPAMSVGSSLEASFHPAHTGRAHLDIVRRAIGVPESAVDEKLDLVGLGNAADRKTGGYSLGMRQRLALAAAMLGDPGVLVLDEPINGLDPEGIRWIRLLLRHLAQEGKTILLSSHLLSEVQNTVDDVVIIREGQLAYTGTLHDLQESAGDEVILVDAKDRDLLAHALEGIGATVSGIRGDRMRVTGLDVHEVGRVALQAAVPLTHLSVERRELELRFLDLIEGSAHADESGQAPGAYPSATNPGGGAA